MSAHWYSVSLLDVEDKILDKGHFVQGEDDLKSSCRHLGQHEQIEGGGINLQVAPVIVSHHRPTRTYRPNKRSVVSSLG